MSMSSCYFQTRTDFPVNSLTQPHTNENINEEKTKGGRQRDGHADR